MKNNEKIELPIKMGKRPFVWRQAVTGSPHKGWSLRNMFLYPILYFQYSFKNHQSFLCDSLIIGSNPVLNLLLLKKIANQAFYEQKHQKVGILNIEDGDYWAYHELKKDSFWKEFNEAMVFKVKGLETFMDDIIKNTSWDYIEPVFIETQDLSIQFVRKEDEVNGYIGHLMEKKIDKTVFSPQMPTVIESENQLKTQLWQELVRKCLNSVESFKKLKWSIPTAQTPDNAEKTHIFLTKKIYLTSLAQGWLNIQTEQKEGFSYFKSEFSEQSFGSAIKIANDFLKLEKQVLQDIQDLNKTKITLS